MITLVGECPGRESIADRPSLALTGSSGRNLCAIAGWEWLDYLRYTRRFNLFLDPQDRWSSHDAAVAAVRLLPDIVGEGLVVLCGSRVADAFALDELPLFTWQELTPSSAVARIPHPSGRSRAWNDPETRAKARLFLQDLVP